MGHRTRPEKWKRLVSKRLYILLTPRKETYLNTFNQNKDHRFGVTFFLLYVCLTRRHQLHLHPWVPRRGSEDKEDRRRNTRDVGGGVVVSMGVPRSLVSTFGDFYIETENTQKKGSLFRHYTK